MPDVLKALCLGAKAVGMGRPFLYAQSVSLLQSRSVPLSPVDQISTVIYKAYGEQGVKKLIHILEREIVLGMRLLGATNVKELVPEMVGQQIIAQCSVTNLFSRSNKCIGNLWKLSFRNVPEKALQIVMEYIGMTKAAIGQTIKSYRLCRWTFSLPVRPL